MKMRIIVKKHTDNLVWANCISGYVMHN